MHVSLKIASLNYGWSGEMERLGRAGGGAD